MTVSAPPAADFRHGRAGNDPEHPAKPDTPAEITKPSWIYVLRKTGREFSRDQCTDAAAALTYYSVLALFPALVAVLSLVGLVGQTQQTVERLLQILRDVGAASVADTLEPTIRQLAQAPGAGLALVTGLLAAVWSASGYTSAFGRALNRMYEIGEGRPFWKLRPAMLLLTVVLLLLAAAVAVALVVTGPAAEAVGNALGVGATAVTVWNYAKWPVLLAVVIVIVALLYWGTPNVEQPKFRWVGIGSALAILDWALASAAFGFYVANFSSYNKTYGSLAGVVVFLLWLWITNLALLFGAELDAELERGRELQAGIPAEAEIQLPPRDTRALDKNVRRLQEDIDRGRRLRLGRGREDDTGQDLEHQLQQGVPMSREKQTSKSAMILYRPVGIISSIVAGLLAGRVFEQVWKRVSADKDADPPGALQTEYPVREILLAAALQGAIFAVVRTAVNRGGARMFERWTGEWPGD